MILTTLSSGNRTMILNSSVRYMEQLFKFNALLYRLQKVTGVKTEMFNKKLAEWLRRMPDNQLNF